MLAGKFYNEDVDTYAFGIVMYEIAVREYPYRKEKSEFRKRGGRKGATGELMKAISVGDVKPELRGHQACRRYHIGSAFQASGLLWQRSDSNEHRSD